MPLPQRCDGCCHEKVDSSRGLRGRGGGNPTRSLDKVMRTVFCHVAPHTRALCTHAAQLITNDRCARTTANYNIF